VLLDSATPEQFTALPNYPGCYSTDRHVSGVLPTLARLGVGRIVAATQSAGLPAQARQHEQAFAATAGQARIALEQQRAPHHRRRDPRRAARRQAIRPAVEHRDRAGRRRGTNPRRT
jgi:hypothetical protein